MEKIIEFRNISVEFDGRQVLENISFSLAESESIALVGRSGSGKTTIMNMIMGFIKPTAGEINVFSKDISASLIREKISWLPQDLSIIGRGNLEDVIYQPFLFEKNRNIKPTKEKIKEHLDKVKIDSMLLESDYEELSGGEKQRVGLVICRLLQRPLMLLDEPTSALDEDSRDAVIDYLMNQPERAILSTSHDPKWIENCDKKIELRK